MAKTLYDKLWDAHVVHQESDGTCLLYIDRHLVHEVTSPQAFEGLGLAGRKPWRVSANLAVADHNVPTTARSEGIADPISRLQVDTLDENCEKYGITEFRMTDKRQGIVHIIGPEQGATLPGMTVASWQQRPESAGYVRIRSADPFEPPAINPMYLDKESDRRVLLAGMKLARGLLRSRPLEPYYDFETFPGPDVQTDDELLAAAKARGTTTFHPMGTCRMGPASDPSAVVDDRLCVHGVAGLRVVDASIMPMMISGNTNATCIMIGEKAADLIRGRALAAAA